MVKRLLILLILLILPMFLFAELNVAKVNKTLLGIKAQRPVSFYNANSNFNLQVGVKVTSIQKADIILFPKEIPSNKAIIVNSYKALKLHKNSIGAIYLRKGRTQIVFVKERLNIYGLRLSKGFDKHLIQQWQLNPVALFKSLK